MLLSIFESFLSAIFAADGFIRLGCKLYMWRWRELNPRPGMCKTCFYNHRHFFSFRNWLKEMPPHQLLASNISVKTARLCLNQSLQLIREREPWRQQHPFTPTGFKRRELDLRLQLNANASFNEPTPQVATMSHNPSQSKPIHPLSIF